MLTTPTTDEHALRIRVAELRGWTPNGLGYWHLGDRTAALEAEEADPQGDHDGWESLPDYPRDNNAAMELREKLTSAGWLIDVTFFADECTITLWRDYGKDHYAFTAPTFALAICRAFVAVMEGK